METRSNHILVGSVVLALLAAVIIAAFWFSRVTGGDEKLYDIFFRQSVTGLAKGSSVTFAGVPSGQVQEIELWKKDPSFVRVRISVKEDLPVLQGMTATIRGVGFTGVSEIQLDGAVKGAPPITCPPVNPEAECPEGVPVIPTKPGALGELLNTAPVLIERLSTLTERLTELLSDRNQASIAAILDNVERVTGVLAARAPEISATIAETRIAIEQTGKAAEELSRLAGTTNAILDEEGRPLISDLRKSVQAARSSMESLDATIAEARPGLHTLSTRTMPEIDLLVRDLRSMTRSLNAVAEKIDERGAGSLLRSPDLPDYEGK